MSAITVNGIEYTVHVPDDINELAGPLDALRKASAEFIAADSLLSISETALRTLTATGKVLGVLCPSVPARVIQGATLGELEGVICTVMGHVLEVHGAAASELWQGRPFAELN